MSSRKWLYMFVGSVLLIMLAFAGFNILTDPFGVFGDVIFDWYSYDMTLNPRVAKIAYLDKHYEQYDSYVLGPSGASPLLPSVLNAYTGADFYNLFVYGADLYDTRLMAEYVVENYNVKRMILVVSPINAEIYDKDKDGLKIRLHAGVDKTSLPAFYLSYALADPKYAIEKLTARRSDSYMPQKFDVFLPETGVYDKSVRDIEPISETEAYLVANTVFVDPKLYKRTLKYTEQCMEAVSDIKALCDANGIELTVVIPPMYHTQVGTYDAAEIAEFYARLSEITDFWDFAVSSFSAEPRYFYDLSHCRNTVGNMMAARIYNDESVYVPDDFGAYVTTQNARERAETYARAIEAETVTKNIPVLLYHHLAEESTNSATVSTDVFESHIKALADAGYTGISVQELAAFIETDAELPENPVLITFDDGYSSNYELAYPILQKYNMKATVFAIGVSVGKATYKNTDTPITPHFGLDEILEMMPLISVQSHSFDMHQVEGLDDPAAFRSGVLQRDGEKESDYVESFTIDFVASEELLAEEVIAYAYPYGSYTTITEVMLNKLGVKMTFTTKPHVNLVIKGLSQSLFALGRFTITEEVTTEELLALLRP